MIDQLVDTGLVKSIPDLYRLTLADLLELERMGEKSGQNLLDGIEASKSRGLSRLLAGLAIPHVGEAVADLLGKHFGTHRRLMNAAGSRPVGRRGHRPDHGQGHPRLLPGPGTRADRSTTSRRPASS